MEATISSHGVLAIGGVVAFAAGGLMLVEGPIPELRVRLSTILAIAVPLVLIALFLARLVYRSQGSRSPTGYSGMLGTRGVAITPIHESGKIEVQGEVWNVRSKQAIPQGATVRIVGAEGLTLEVESGNEGDR
jgi:membrane-bound serine protease (ClpP class)